MDSNRLKYKILKVLCLFTITSLMTFSMLYLYMVYNYGHAVIWWEKVINVLNMN